MVRIPREVPECGYFHITLRGNNKRCIFWRDSEFRYFKSLIHRYKIKHKCLLYHYALMKNHVHLLVKTTMETILSKFMQGLELSYYHYRHNRRGYVGHLWQGRFKSQVIDDDKYLLASSLYIDANPATAGFVDDPADYPWTSYRYYAFGEKDPLVDRNPYYMNLGTNEKERQENYRRLVASRVEELRRKKM